MTSAAWLALGVVCFATAAGLVWLMRMIDDLRYWRDFAGRMAWRAEQYRAVVAAVTDGATALDDGRDGPRVWSVPEAVIEAAFRARYDEAAKP